MASLTEITGNLGTDRAAHLLRRATFGPTIAQINQFAGYTVTEAMNALFTEPAQNPAPPIDPQTAATWWIHWDKKKRVNQILSRMIYLSSSRPGILMLCLNREQT